MLMSLHAQTQHTVRDLAFLPSASPAAPKHMFTASIMLMHSPALRDARAIIGIVGFFFFKRGRCKCSCADYLRCCLLVRSAFHFKMINSSLKKHWGKKKTPDVFAVRCMPPHVIRIYPYTYFTISAAVFIVIFI